MSDPSFVALATVTASTKRVGAYVDSLPPDPVENIASLKCLPLLPVNPELFQRYRGQRFQEILHTYVEGGLDIKRGDLLVVGSTEYPIQAVGEWYWPPDDANRLHLILADRQ